VSSIAISVIALGTAAADEAFDNCWNDCK
jgi:hypothetical protein